jgi:hypothetical protein
MVFWAKLEPKAFDGAEREGGASKENMGNEGGAKERGGIEVKFGIVEGEKRDMGKRIFRGRRRRSGEKGVK